MTNVRKKARWIRLDSSLCSCFVRRNSRNLLLSDMTVILRQIYLRTVEVFDVFFTRHVEKELAVSVVMSNEIVCLVFAPTCTICSYYSVTMSISLIGVVPSLAAKLRCHMISPFGHHWIDRLAGCKIQPRSHVFVDWKTPYILY